MNKILSFLVILAAVAAIAQENTRQLWNEEFMKSRPPGKAAPKPTVNYKPVGPPKAASAPVGSGTMVGVTLWKVRPAESTDKVKSRLLVLVRPGEKPKEEVPERVDPNTELVSGDQFRLTVEVPSSGYLYVIDREKFKSGLGPPYLIYPNFQTRTGDNVVAPGRLIEIPDRRDEFNVFQLEPKPNQLGEVLSLLVSPQPIPDLKIGKEPLKLEAALYESWQKKWGVEAQQFELAGAEGQTWTDKESEAGANRTTTLTQEDALPQTLYRLSVKPGSTVLVEVPLKIKQK